MNAPLKILFFLYLAGVECGVIVKRNANENEIIENPTTITPLATTLINEKAEEIAELISTTTVPVTLVTDSTTPLLDSSNRNSDNDNNANDDDVIPEEHFISTTTSSATESVDDGDKYTFDFSRYTTTPPLSELPERPSKILDKYFEEKRKALINAEFTTKNAETTTEYSIFSTTVASLDPNDIKTNVSSEKNTSLTHEVSAVETANYEVASNEIKNGTKKGKYLNHENNDINYVWALASMLNEETKNSTGHVKNETNEILKDGENQATNNTLKQLTDWSEVMKIIDYANSSYINTVTEKEGGDVTEKVNEKYIDDSEAIAAENKITLLQPETTIQTTSSTTPIPPTVAEEDNKIDTIGTTKDDDNFIVTTQRKTMVQFVPPTTTTTTEDTVEDFTFMKEKPNKPAQYQVEEVTELTNYISETTINDRADNFPLFTTPRTFTTSRGYQVSENVDENYDFYDVVSTTVQNEINTEFEEVPTTVPTPTTTITTPKPIFVTQQSPINTEAARTTRETVTTSENPISEPAPTTAFPEYEEETTLLPITTTTEPNEPIVNEVAQKINNNNVDAETTMTTETEDNMMAQPSTILPHYVEIKPLTTTEAIANTLEVNHVDRTTEAIQPTNRTEIDFDDKNKYSVETTALPEPLEEARSTAETMPEEESVTEDDYILVTVVSTSTTDLQTGELEDESDTGLIIAITTSIVGVVAAVLLVVALFVLKKRQNQVTYGQRCRPVGLDAYSLDNVSVYNSVRRNKNAMRLSKRSYGNSAFEDPGLRANSLTVAELAMFIQNKNTIYDEFKEIPQVTVRPDEVPDGCEDKNRYANVIPLPETRVHLKRLNDEEKSEYINANFVKGPKDSTNYYIACQAPMENTITDFWRMIWEQNSKVIIMATDLSENGVEKCADYLPPSVVLDNNRTFGDFHITLKNREMKDKYSISTVHLKNAQTNTWREIMHFWYQWPDTGVPSDENTVIAMLLEARSYLRLSPAEQSDNEQSMNNNNSVNNNISTNNNESSPNTMTNGTIATIDKHRSLQRTQGPLTVHCSPGTGRTGTIVACDIALRVLEIPPRNIDVPQLVYYVRRGRASAVRTREQYEFIYRVANVYATKLTGPNIEN